MAWHRTQVLEITQSGDVIMKRLNVLMAFIAMLTLAACNTVQGVGKDIQAGGKAVEKVAK
jgi:entericidin B